MTNTKNINNTKASHLFVAFCPSLQSLSSLSSFSSEQKSIKNLRPYFLTFFMKQALIFFTSNTCKQKNIFNFATNIHTKDKNKPLR